MSIETKIVKLSSPDEDPALAEEVARFTWKELWDRPNPSPVKVRSVANSLSDRTTVAAVDKAGKILAVGGLEGVNPDTGTASIVEVATASDSRGAGLGREVMRALEDEARAQGVGTVALHSLRESEGFYEKLGYEPTNGIITTHEKRI